MKRKKNAYKIYLLFQRIFLRHKSYEKMPLKTGKYCDSIIHN